MLNAQKQTKITTDELAAMFRVKPESVRTRLCKTGSYFDWVPEKLPNRFLIWTQREGK